MIGLGPIPEPGRLACVLFFLVAAPAGAQVSGGPVTKFTVASAEAPAADSLAWNKPAQLAYLKTSDKATYYNIDLALQIKYAMHASGICADCFQTFSMAPLWQRSTVEDKPFNNRGIKLGYSLYPKYRLIDYRLLVEFKASANDTGEIGADHALAMTEQRQKTGKIAVLFDDLRLLPKNGYVRFRGNATLYSDDRSKSTVASVNGRESGIGAKLQMLYFPLGLPRRDVLQIATEFQRQYDFRASGGRTESNYEYFMVDASTGLGAFGPEGPDGERWRPSLSVQRTGGQDVTTGLPRRFVSQIALQLRYSAN